MSSAETAIGKQSTENVVTEGEGLVDGNHQVSISGAADPNDFLRRVIQQIPTPAFIKVPGIGLAAVNAAFAEEFRCTLGDLSLRSSDRYENGKGEQGFFSADSKALESGKPVMVRESIMNGDGDLRQLKVVKQAVYDADGSAIALMCVPRDITTEVRLQEENDRLQRENEFLKNQLIESRRLSLIGLTTAQFVSASHTAFTAMTTIGEVLLMGLLEEGAELDKKSLVGRLKDLIRIGKQESARLNALLDFGTRKGEVSLEILSVHDVVREVKITSFFHKNINLSISDIDKDLFVFGNPFRLKLAILDLCLSFSNLKHTSTERSISISAYEVDVSNEYQPEMARLVPEGKYVCISVFSFVSRGIPQIGKQRDATTDSMLFSKDFEQGEGFEVISEKNKEGVKVGIPLAAEIFRQCDGILIIRRSSSREIDTFQVYLPQMKKNSTK